MALILCSLHVVSSFQREIRPIPSIPSIPCALVAVRWLYSGSDPLLPSPCVFFQREIRPIPSIPPIPCALVAVRWLYSGSDPLLPSRRV